MKMNVFFDKVCHINNFFRLLLKNSSIALLPNISPKIHQETIKGGFLFLIKNFSAHFPPFLLFRNEATIYLIYF